MTTFTDEERQFVRNYLSERRQDGSREDGERIVCNDIFNALRGGNADLSPQQIGYLQIMAQELGEIYGRRSSTANEKLDVVGVFLPGKMIQLLRSIITKLGATPYLSDEPYIPNSPRSEGSTGIMIDPTLIK